METKELKRTVSSFRRGLLGNDSPEFMCFAVCAPLQGYLSMLGLETVMVEGEVDCADYNVNHFWLELSDGRIIDPTADQFLLLGTERRMPKVYIGDKPEWYAPKRWVMGWLKDLVAWDSVKAMFCFGAHGHYWKYVRHAEEIDDDVGEYFCPTCNATRFKREWL